MLLGQTKKFLKYFIILVLFPPICWGIDDKSDLEQKYSQKMAPVPKEQITQPPYNAVLSILCKFEYGEDSCYARATGFLIDGNFALTAAHVLYDDNNNLATTIYIGLYGEASEKSPQVQLCICPNEYKRYLDKIPTKLSKKEGDYKYLSVEDYTLLYFDVTQGGTYIKPFVVSYGYLQSCGNLNLYAYYAEAESNGWFRNICSYFIEESRDLQEIYLDGGREETELLTFSTQCYRGMSGGSVTLFERNKYRAIAILSYICNTKEKEHENHSSTFCRFTRSKVNNIENWKEIVNMKLDTETLRRELLRKMGTLHLFTCFLTKKKKYIWW